METEKGLVKKETPPSFIEKLMLNSESLEQIKEVGAIIIKSGFCPDHFKTANDAVGIIMCIEAGRQLGLTWMQSLSDLYPVKGRIGMMGSAARSLIFSSGILDKWEELTEGVYPEDTYKHIIVSKRKGFPGEFRSEFTVYDAKKAGLFTKDIYQRYGKRMIMWRNIGFHATDYYGDVMKGMKTVEELNDFDAITPGTETTILKNEDGTEITIKDADKKHSKKITDRVADKIPDNKFGAVKNENIQEAEIITAQDINEGKSTVSDKIEELKKEESPFIPGRGSVEFFDGKEVSRNEVPGKEGDLTMAVMEKMEAKDLLKIVNEDMDMMEASEIIGGKNTGKKLRELIFAHQQGRLAEHVAPYLKEKEHGEDDGLVHPIVSGEIAPNKDFEKKPEEKQKEIDDFLSKEPLKKQEANTASGNKYSIEVPAYDKGDSREFSTVKTLFNKLMGIEPQITTPRYMNLATKLGLFEKYPDKENFLKFASVAEINTLLNAN